MEIEFIPDEQVSNRSSIMFELRLFLKALEEHPDSLNRWAKFPLPLNSGSSIPLYRKQFPQFVFRGTGGNNLPTKHPNKKLWTLHIKFTGSEEVN